MKLENINVYNLENAIRASKFPMAVDVEKADTELTKTVEKLGKADPGTGHDNFLQGILVSFDLTCTNKMWVEFERYHFADIVSSQSTMHRIARIAKTPDCFNSYVTKDIIKLINKLVDKYNETGDKEDYLTLLYSIPAGIELTAQVVTNYRQLKTMVIQRHNHRLPEWREFCKSICELPKFSQLTGVKFEN